MSEGGAVSSLVEIVNCTNCAAELKFKPGTDHLVCPYCKTENKITDHAVPIEEIDYEEFLRDKYDDEEKLTVREVKCSSCGAETVFPDNVSSIDCPYCRNSLVLEGGSDNTVLKPRAILPFKITPEEARQYFDKWLKGKWFLPSDLKRVRRLDEKITGIYIPYWTFDSHTFSHYTGERGVHYTTTVPVRQIVNGKPVITQQVVTKTRWTPVSGNVRVNFDDTLIVASSSLSEKYIERLEPFDMHNLVPFDEKYLAGFRAEIYQIGVKDAFEKVKLKMGMIIRAHIQSDIGGDVQRIHSSHTEFNDVTFKHVLLPIWVSAYRYRKKVYRFLINARTGEVHGDRPYDAWKITIAVLLGILVVLAIVVISQMTQG